jgi:hypothetical protein
MIEFLALIIGFFLTSLIVLIILIGVKFFHGLITAGQSSNNYSEEIDNQLRENSKEDSQADLYMSGEPEDYGNLMFPEEFDEEEI